MQILLGIIIILAVVGIIVGFPIGIFLFIRAKGEQDETKKQHIKKQAKWYFYAPLLLLLLGLIISFVNGFIIAASQK
jgi:H+/Cl- antiporter ClcA